MIERQELYCHNCGGYVQFDMDLSLNGNHVLTCPKCGHQHCRVVKDGVITGIRWDQRNSDSSNVNTMYIPTSSISYTAQSTFSTYISSTTFAINLNAIAPALTDGTGDRNGRSYLYGAWMNVVSTS